MSKPMRWGILGTGNIARQFAEGVTGSQRCVLVSVGSRKPDTAAAFAQHFHIPGYHGDYEAVLRDPEVEAVYISLPNSLHHEWTIKALEAGKHVLCEKPIAVNAAQAREMFDAARRRGLLLAEALMYRSHPQTKRVLELVRAGAIGRVKLLKVSFCFCLSQWRGNVRFSPELAGGGLLDVGCYCVDFSRLVTGEEPTSVHVVARRHESGVDDLACGTLAFPGGAISSFACGMTAHTDNSAFLCGDGGYIHVPVPWKPAVSGATFTLATMTPARMDRSAAGRGPTRQTFTVDAGKPLYALEADDFAAAVRDGAAPAVTPESSLATMRVLDELRKQAGF